MALQQLKNFEEALEIYSTLTKYSNLLKEVDYNIGLCYYHLQEFRKSADYLKKYMFNSQQDLNIYTHLCKVLYKIAAYEEINEICEKAEVWRVKKIPYFVWSCALYKLNKLKKAHLELVQAMKTDMDNCAMWNMLGKILFVSRYYKEALYSYRKTLSINPNYKNTDLKVEKVLKKISKKPKSTENHPLVVLDDPLVPGYNSRSRNCEDLFCRIL